MKVLFATLAIAVLGCSASADTLWTYTGNVMAPCGCALDGNFTTATPVTYPGTPAILSSWSFTDGTHTLTNLNSTASIELYQPTGWPLLWHIFIQGVNVEFLTYFYGSAFEATDASGAFGASFGYLQGNRGTLTGSPVATPEPGTLALLGVGLMGLLARRSKSGIST